MKLQVHEICGPVCVDPDDGQVLCERAHEILANEQTVEFDFEGVTTLTSSFLNAAVGCLYASYPHEFLATALKWSGLDPADDSVMRLVQANAIRFFSANEDQQRRLADAALQQNC